VLSQRLGSGLRKRSTATDGGDAAIRFYDIPLPAEQEHLFAIRDKQQCFEMTQEFIRAPVFRQFNGRAAKVAVVLLQFLFKPAEQRKRIGGGTCKACQNLVLVEPADLLGRVLDYGLAEGYLAVAGQYNLPIAANRQNSGRTYQSLF